MQREQSSSGNIISGQSSPNLSRLHTNAVLSSPQLSAASHASFVTANGETPALENAWAPPGPSTASRPVSPFLTAATATSESYAVWQESQQQMDVTRIDVSVDATAVLAQTPKRYVYHMAGTTQDTHITTTTSQDPAEEEDTHALAISPDTNLRELTRQRYDFPPYAPPPTTARSFLYNILVLPFLQGVAQGLGTAAASWLLYRMASWSLGERWLPARIRSRLISGWDSYAHSLHGSEARQEGGRRE